MKERTIASIDVGTTKVCTAIADMNGGGSLQIVGVGIAPSRGRDIHPMTTSVPAAVAKPIPGRNDSDRICAPTL